MERGSLFKAPSCFRRGLGVVNSRRNSLCITSVIFFKAVNPVFI